MSEFTASNGITIGSDSGRVQWKTDGRAYDLEEFASGSDLDVALSEWYRAREDERLGRWRWPADPGYVVYQSSNGVHVVRESDGLSLFYAERAVAEKYPDYDPARAAAAYFEAHPERRPWEDAKPGEVWELTLSDEEPHPYLVAGNGRFIDVHRERFALGMHNQAIVDARRIWPEEAA